MKLKKVTLPIDSIVKEYLEVSGEVKTLEKRKKELGEQIKKYAIKHIPKNDNGDMLRKEFNYVFGQVIKRKVTLDQEKALKMLKEKGLTSIIDNIEVVNEDKLSSALDEGVVTLDELNGVTNIQESYALKVGINEEEEMPEVEVGELKK